MIQTRPDVQSYIKEAFLLEIDLVTLIPIQNFLLSTQYKVLYNERENEIHF